MEIVRDISGIEQKLADFHQRNWPNRKMDFVESFKWRTELNPFHQLTTPSVFVAIENDQVIGQIILIHSAFICNEEKFRMVWGTDLMVDKAHRGTTAGVSLTRKALKTGVHFGSGFSYESEKLHQILGEKKLGTIDKYIGKTSLRSLIGTKSNSKKILTEGELFQRVEAVELGQAEFRRNSSFLRVREFFDWRFGQAPLQYQCFLNADKTCYFVARKIKVKSIPMLKLVDYRFSRDEQFSEILDALDLLAGAQKVPIKFVSASTPSLKMQIQEAGFTKKRSSSILSNFDQLKIDELIVTPADSDGDFWG